MPQTNVNIQMDKELKQDFDAVCVEIGLTTAAAFTVFAKAVTKKRRLPFNTSDYSMLNDITLASEKALAKDWLLPEEDEAWANL